MSQCLDQPRDSVLCSLHAFETTKLAPAGFVVSQLLAVEPQVASRAAVVARILGAIAWAVALSLARFADEQTLVLPRVLQNVLVKRCLGLLPRASPALVELRHAALHARLARERR